MLLIWLAALFRGVTGRCIIHPRIKCAAVAVMMLIDILIIKAVVLIPLEADGQD